MSADAPASSAPHQFGYYAPNVKDGWFSESVVMWGGQKMALEIATKEDGNLDILFEGRSNFQDILAFNSKTYGKVLVLDGVIQLSERDEFAYQEMMVHLPMFAHPNPKKVLIVGGGDGGVLREVAKHPGVEQIDMCEIDSMVCEVAQRFNFVTATAFKDPRLNLVHDDAAKFIAAEGHSFYDVIIVDSSDPVGPAEALFAPPFYRALKDALAPGGVICCQGECMWLHLDLIKNLVQMCHTLFPTVEYAYTCVPTYPSGQIGCLLCSLDERKDACRLPERVPTPELQAQLRYYNPHVHAASFYLPQFAATVVDEARVAAGKPAAVVAAVGKPASA